MKLFDTADVDGFNYISMIDFNGAIGVDSCDCVRSSSWGVHLWLAATFIGI
jgi:hypothetical protein